MTELRPLTDGEIKALLAEQPDWRVETSAGETGKQRIELVRKYRFATFEDAIRFMTEAAKHISAVDHHPRWENSYRNLTVWLTTWDTENCPSNKDAQLAEYLDQLFAAYP